MTVTGATTAGATRVVDTDHTGAPVHVTDLDRDEALWFLEEAAELRLVAERRTLRAVLSWCHANPAVDGAQASSWSEAVHQPGGLDDPEPIGGDGAPLVAAFSAEPLGIALQVSTTSALSWMADALELAHRLPRTHARVEALEVPVWRARQVATATSRLTPDAAAWVDQRVAGRAHRIGVRAIETLVTEALALFDPAQVAETEDTAEDTWDVTLSDTDGAVDQRWAGTSFLHATGDTAVLRDFYDLVCQVAHDLLATHPHRTLGQRKIQALQVIADRARSTTTDGPRQRGGSYKLYLHLDCDDLLDRDLRDQREQREQQPPALGTVERLGPATVERIRRWLTGSRVTVQPVIDLGRTGEGAVSAVDAHDPPAWMREQVILRDRHCVFPDCRRDARGVDLDHIDPYVAPDDGGPPGQTRPGNLAPLCRRHHRAKTTTDPTRRWTYTRTTAGHYAWTGPDGQRLVVVPGLGTYEVGPGLAGGAPQ